MDAFFAGIERCQPTQNRHRDIDCRTGMVILIVLKISSRCRSSGMRALADGLLGRYRRPEPGGGRQLNA
jgi:hypothetical protein